ncbi:hypothetical protein NDU88_011347 [Pleurodeles waltl]|uniref:Uncharacterized protein n=1 Tax=Pleurodeles waltl TaxID=8319 RepID=A0AAV7PXH2_PLEWA|nr:hypothetical protein NDU88_011347 [Pleurodeles waltl]
MLRRRRRDSEGGDYYGLGPYRPAGWSRAKTPQEDCILDYVGTNRWISGIPKFKQQRESVGSKDMQIRASPGPRKSITGTHSSTSTPTPLPAPHTSLHEHFTLLRTLRTPTNTSYSYEHFALLRTLRTPTNTSHSYEHFARLRTLRTPTNTLYSYEHFVLLRTLRTPTNTLHAYEHFALLRTLCTPTNISHSYEHFALLRTFRTPTNTSHSYEHFALLRTLRTPTNTLLSYEHFALLYKHFHFLQYCPTLSCSLYCLPLFLIALKSSIPLPASHIPLVRIGDHVSGLDMLYPTLTT